LYFKRWINEYICTFIKNLVIYLTQYIRHLIKLSFNTPKSTRGLNALLLLSSLSKSCDMFRMSLYVDDTALFLKPTSHDLLVMTCSQQISLPRSILCQISRICQQGEGQLTGSAIYSVQELTRKSARKVESYSPSRGRFGKNIIEGFFITRKLQCCKFLP
jgi:hypothetical protein